MHSVGCQFHHQRASIIIQEAFVAMQKLQRCLDHRTVLRSFVVVAGHHIVEFARVIESVDPMYLAERRHMWTNQITRCSTRVDFAKPAYFQREASELFGSVGIFASSDCIPAWLGTHSSAGVCLSSASCRRGAAFGWRDETDHLRS
jgi:hypothetical protein